MGKNKLKKFADMERFRCVHQFPRHMVIDRPCPLKGNWHKDVFGNSNPITLELGCGKGEYTVGLSQAHPERNHIGVDIKGARIWSGARMVEESNIPNAAFLRTEIEMINFFFSKGEIDEIWITFPDPQMQKCRKRLTSTRFLNLYREFLAPDGIIHLKTDSPFLYEYTRRLAEMNKLEIIRITDDLYGSGMEDPATSIKTFYEQQWLARGKKIKLISFRLNDAPLVEPRADDIPKDDYRAYPRGTVDQSRASRLDK